MSSRIIDSFGDIETIMLKLIKKSEISRLTVLEEATLSMIYHDIKKLWDKLKIMERIKLEE